MNPKIHRQRILARLTREIALDYPPDRVDPASKTPRIRGARQNLIRQFILEAGGTINRNELPRALWKVADSMVKTGRLTRIRRVPPIFLINPDKLVSSLRSARKSHRVLEQVLDLGGKVTPSQIPGSEGALWYLTHLGYLTRLGQIHTRLSLVTHRRRHAPPPIQKLITFH
jgi:hypothetical protein